MEKEERIRTGKKTEKIKVLRLRMVCRERAKNYGKGELNRWKRNRAAVPGCDTSTDLSRELYDATLLSFYPRYFNDTKRTLLCFVLLSKMFLEIAKKNFTPNSCR